MFFCATGTGSPDEMGPSGELYAVAADVGVGLLFLDAAAIGCKIQSIASFKEWIPDAAVRRVISGETVLRLYFAS